MYFYSTKYVVDERNLIFPIKNIPNRNKTTNNVSILEKIVAENNQMKFRRILEKNGYAILLDNLGNVYSLGINFSGQLGLGDNLGRKKIEKIVGLKDIKDIYGGDNFTIALNKYGEIYAWGDNEFGQLGLGDFFNKNSPRKITELNQVVPRKICCGSKHVLMLDKFGSLYVWGSNDNNQLGFENKKLTLSIPTKYPTASTVIDIATTHKSSYFLTDSYDVLSFGDNSFGQLGTSDFLDKQVPTQIPESKNMKIKSIFADGFSFFAISLDNRVYACGFNNNGKLGFGDCKNKSAPSEILALRNKKITRLVSSKDKTFAVSEPLNKSYKAENSIFVEFSPKVDISIYYKY